MANLQNLGLSVTDLAAQSDPVIQSPLLEGEALQPAVPSSARKASQQRPGLPQWHLHASWTMICSCNTCIFVKQRDNLGKKALCITQHTAESRTMAPVPMADAKEGSNPVEKVVKSKQASAGKALPEFFEARIKKFEELQKEQAEQRVQKGGHPIKYALRISYQ